MGSLPAACHREVGKAEILVGGRAVEAAASHLVATVVGGAVELAADAHGAVGGVVHDREYEAVPLKEWAIGQSEAVASGGVMVDGEAKRAGLLGHGAA